MAHLKEYFEEHNIKLPQVKLYSEFEFDVEQGLEGGIYPKPGGLMKNLLYHDPELNIMNVEGPDKVYREMIRYMEADDKYKPAVLDVLNCEFGCNDGPAVGQDYDFMHMNTIMHDVEKYTHGERLKHTKRGKDEQYERFDRELKIDDFIREYTPENIDKVVVSDRQLEEGFKVLRKETETERHFDCHACGFRSCADMAKAIVRGLNLPENCNQYMLKKIRSEQERIAGINEEVHQMMEKVRSVTEELDREMGEVKEAAAGIGKVGQENSNEMQNVITYMEGLEKLKETILTGMQDINVNAGKYREMSESVEQIAKDINLLSLNASIEAARAGEAGKGFAVVAENIRRLSDESKQSVAESQNNDKQITSVIKSVNQTVEGFSENIKNLTDVVNTAIEGVNQSSVKSEDIQTITGEMEEILQHITEMVERTNEILTEGERL